MFRWWLVARFHDTDLRPDIIAGIVTLGAADEQNPAPCQSCVQQPVQGYNLRLSITNSSMVHPPVDVIHSWVATGADFYSYVLPPTSTTGGLLTHVRAAYAVLLWQRQGYEQEEVLRWIAAPLVLVAHNERRR